MGKGQRRRPPAEGIPDRSIAEAWCRSAGHRFRGEPEWCVNCGKTRAELDGVTTGETMAVGDATGEP